jgi:hypothetical protein
MVDPAYPGCNWELPAGSADPFSIQFKSVASLGNGCPTLDLPYAAPLNMVTDKNGLPIDAQGQVIDTNNPRGLPQFKDLDGDGELYDDQFLKDTRLRPMPNADATKKVDRYSIVVPKGTRGPIAISAGVYYQSVEAIVALKFLGNMTDTNNNFVLEPCVLGGLCDGRKPTAEPAVVEGSAPVPVAFRNWMINVDGSPAVTAPPAIATYPAPGADHVYLDPVVKVTFSRPVRPIDERNLTLTDSQGVAVPSTVEQIGEGTYALFPNQIVLKAGETYQARLAPGVCDTAGVCTTSETAWKFTVTSDANQGTGNTSVPTGFVIAAAAAPSAMR